MPRQFDDLTLVQLEEAIHAGTVEIRNLEARATILQTELKPIADTRARLLSDAGQRKIQIAEMEREIARRKAPKPQPTVTDHALLRYIERVCEIDIEALRQHILTPTVRQAIEAGATAVKTQEFVAKVSGNAITTITVNENPTERKPNKLTRARLERMQQDVDDLPDGELCESDWVQRYAR